MGEAFNQGLDKKAENYKEEGAIKLLKDIRDRMVRPIGGNNDNRNNDGDDNGDDDRDDDEDDDRDDDEDDDGDDDGDDDEDDDNNRDDGYDDNNDDNRDDRIDSNNEEADYLTKKFTILKNRKSVQERINALRKELNNNNNGDDGNDKNDEITEMGSIDLSWMNDLQLYRQIASEVFARYDRDKDLLELFTLRTFIDNISNERVKNKKDAREEFKTVKKNVKSGALKEIVKDLEQAIFGHDNKNGNNGDDDNDVDDDNDDNDDNDGNNEDIKEVDSLTKRFTILNDAKIIKEIFDEINKNDKNDKNDNNRDNDDKKGTFAPPDGDFVNEILKNRSQENESNRNNDNNETII